MERLSDKAYWETVHRSSGAPSRSRAMRACLRRLLGAKLVANSRSYAGSAFWRVLEDVLPKAPGLKALEIGSAPGHHLVELHRRFHYVPFGVEYSDPGVAAQRELFRRHGLPEHHVIQADFLGPDALGDRHGEFDLVLSRGFIEHFSDPGAVLGRHVDLLKPGGMLVVSVPNLRGLNRALTWLTHPSVLKIHNLEIMRLPAFRAAFQGIGLDEICCRYVGTFDFGLFNAAPGTPGMLVLRAGQALQRPVNVVLRLLAGSRGLDNRWTSPELIFVGRKRV